MARPSMAPQAALTLTQELERLDQSITLTLQEIDANFSKAHRIVTASILPIVEQYAKNSANVWQGAQFWKEFFEKSANISLSSYEENADQDQTFATEDDTGLEEGGEPGDEVVDDGDTITTAADGDDDDGGGDDGKHARSELLDSPSVKARTPRDAPQQLGRHEIDWEDDDDNDTGPFTPGPGGARSQGRPSPFLQSGEPSSKHQRYEDLLLHRALDKNYKVQATPHTARKTAGRAPHAQKPAFNPALDSSPMSPELAAPQLRAEIFGPSPGKRAPPTPGISVQRQLRQQAHTPHGATPSARRTLFPTTAAPSGGKGKQADADAEQWDSDSDFDYDMGLSPPKTMQFHVPQSSKFTQTPAREASRRIVEDLLMSAGVPSVTDTMSELRMDGRDDVYARYEAGADDSPSVVRAGRAEDDSF